MNFGLTGIAGFFQSIADEKAEKMKKIANIKRLGFSAEEVFTDTSRPFCDPRKAPVRTFDEALSLPQDVFDKNYDHLLIDVGEILETAAETGDLKDVVALFNRRDNLTRISLEYECRYTLEAGLEQRYNDMIDTMNN